MTWTTGAQVRATVARHWDSGALLRARVPGHEGTQFPLAVKLRRPRAADLSQRWDEVGAWAQELLGVGTFRVETAPVAHKTLGMQRLPVTAWLDTPEQALALIRRTRDAQRFDAMIADTDAVKLDTAARDPLQLLGIGEQWTAVQAVAAWLREHPGSGLYLRQAEIPGAHTKTMEDHKRTLAELVPGPATSGPGWFERRYGFRTPPSQVRFRILDRRLCLLDGVTDMVLPVGDFLRLCPAVDTVFVTENLTNFLSFPDVADSVLVFGAGNEAPELLADMAAERVVYTGDVDTYGFAILDRLRTRLPHARSLLMDMATLLDHRAMWVHEKTQVTRDLPHLTAGEQQVYDSLRSNALGQHVRLEQERIGYAYLRAAVRGDAADPNAVQDARPMHASDGRRF